MAEKASQNSPKASGSPGKIAPSLLDAVLAIRGTGRFAVTGSVAFEFPGLVVDGEEEVAFPLPPSQARELIARAEAAPFGKGEHTVLDDSVRRGWRIGTSRLAFTGPAWETVLSGIVADVAEALGVEGPVVAEPYQLLLYEKGGFFLPHRDTEKRGAMFGSLVVGFPSAHQGGQLVIRHEGSEETADFSGVDGLRQIQYAAFFADCEHEVLPVTSGYRLCLTCNLALKGGKRGKRVPDRKLSAQVETLRPHLEALSGTAGNELAAIALEHRYTPKNLSVRGLKNHDRARAAALFAAAERAGFDACLGLVTLYQMGELENDYEDYDHRYSRSWKRGRWDKEEPSGGRMGEIHEESLKIGHWRTPEDRALRRVEYRIDPSRIVAPALIGSGEPDEQEEEGYTGNAGCTMEYWYHEAVVVLWPKEAREEIEVRYDFSGACEQLARMAGKKGAGENRAFQRLARAAIRELARKLASHPDSAGGVALTESLPVLEALARVRSETLLEESQEAGVLDRWLALAGPPLWKKLFAGFGEERFEAFFEVLLAGDIAGARYPCLAALEALLAGRKTVPALGRGLAGALPELLPLAAKVNAGKRWGGDLDESGPVHAFHVALAGSFLVGAAEDRGKLEAGLRGDRTLEHVCTVLGPALLEKTLRHRYGHPDSLVRALREVACAVLEEEVRRPLGPYPDWARPAPAELTAPVARWGAHSDDLHGELANFLTDPDREEHRFKAVQHIRAGLEATIRRLELDLDCRTEKKGTPHSLVCVKNSRSYQRALRVRAEDEVHLKRLREVGEE